MRRLLFGSAVIAVMALLGSVDLANAHADVDHASPAAGASVTIAPKLVEIWFDEEIDKTTTIDVKGSNGRSIIAEPATLDLFDPNRAHVTVKLKPNLDPGIYTVEWTSVSAEDGDAESGTYQFTVKAGTPVASPVASPIASPKPVTPTATAATPVARVAAATTPPAESDYPTRELLIALGAGLFAAILIYGFWRLVKPKKSDD